MADPSNDGELANRAVVCVDRRLMILPRSRTRECSQLVAALDLNFCLLLTVLTHQELTAGTCPGVPLFSSSSSLLLFQTVYISWTVISHIIN